MISDVVKIFGFFDHALVFDDNGVLWVERLTGHFMIFPVFLLVFWSAVRHFFALTTFLVGRLEAIFAHFMLDLLSVVQIMLDNWLDR